MLRHGRQPFAYKKFSRVPEVELTEIAPGINLERDVLGQMGFRPRIAQPLLTMDRRLYATGPMGLAADFEARS